MKLTQNQQIEKLTIRIRELQQRKFYGKVTLDIQGGNLLRLVTERSEKVEDIDGESSSEAQADGVEDQEAAKSA